MSLHVATVFMDAAESGDAETVELLLEAGADPRPALPASKGPFAGMRAADLARRLRHSESAELLDRAEAAWGAGRGGPDRGGLRS